MRTSTRKTASGWDGDDMTPLGAIIVIALAFTILALLAAFSLLLGKVERRK